MVVTKRIAATIGALALASTLAACGSAPREVDADQPDKSEGEQAGGSAEEGEQSESAPEDPFDGSIVTFSNLNADNVAGLCSELFGEVTEVLDELDISSNVDASQFGDWEESFEDVVGHSEFGCHASGAATGENENNDENFHIFVSSNLSTPGESAEITARSDTNEAAMSFNLPAIESSAEREDVVDSAVVTQFLESEVLPKFQP